MAELEVADTTIEGAVSRIVIPGATWRRGASVAAACCTWRRASGATTSDHDWPPELSAHWNPLASSPGPADGSAEWSTPGGSAVLASTENPANLPNLPDRLDRLATRHFI